MVTLVSPLQSRNAELPIDVTELGMVTLAKFNNPYAKQPGILRTLFPIFMVEIFVFLKGYSSGQKSAHESALKLRVSNDVQPWNARLPI